MFFFFLSSGELSSDTVMEDVCKKTGVRDQQLDQEIPESDIVEKCPHLLSLHKVDSTIIIRTYHPDILVRGTNLMVYKYTCVRYYRGYDM